MEEYEYILLSIDNFLSFYNTMSICLENYSGLNYPNAFENFFECYQYFHKDFQKRKPQNVTAEICRLRTLKELHTKQFMKNIQPKYDKSASQNDYNVFLENENELKNDTLETQLLLYPYILKQLRISEEKK